LLVKIGLSLASRMKESINVITLAKAIT
jgi:hypothetical protein